MAPPLLLSKQLEPGSQLMGIFLDCGTGHGWFSRRSWGNADNWKVNGNAWTPLQGRSLNQVIFLHKNQLSQLGSFQNEHIKAALGTELFHCHWGTSGLGSAMNTWFWSHVHCLFLDVLIKKMLFRQQRYCWMKARSSVHLKTYFLVMF